MAQLVWATDDGTSQLLLSNSTYNRIFYLISLKAKRTNSIAKDLSHLGDNCITGLNLIEIYSFSVVAFEVIIHKDYDPIRLFCQPL